MLQRVQRGQHRTLVQWFEKSQYVFRITKLQLRAVIWWSRTRNEFSEPAISFSDLIIISRNDFSNPMLHLRIINYLRSCNNESSNLTSSIPAMMWDFVSSSGRHCTVQRATLRDIKARSDSERCRHCTRGCHWRLAVRAIRIGCAQIPKAPMRSAFTYFLFKWEVPF